MARSDNRLDLRSTLRMLREAKGMTQQQLAEAAGVSVSTIRRLECDADARLQRTTEREVEFMLGLRPGGLDHLRGGGVIDDAFEPRALIRFPRGSGHGEAPLNDIVVTDSHIATVMSDGLGKLLGQRAEEVALLASGRLFTAARDAASDRVTDWLPWPACVLATPAWLDRFMDSLDQVHGVLKRGEVPAPLRVAEAVGLYIAYDRAWAIDTNSFFHGGEEISDPFTETPPDTIYQHADPRPMFDRHDPASEWVPDDSLLHPFRWWQVAERDRGL